MPTKRRSPVDEPTPPLDPRDGITLPEDPLERTKLMLEHTDRSLFLAIQEGKGRAATDLASVRRKLSDQLQILEAERIQREHEISEEAARDEVLVFVKSLAPEDPMRAKLRALLVG